MAFKTPLLLHLWHTHQISYLGHSSNLSVFGGEMGMNHVTGVVGTYGEGEGVLAEECCRAHGEQVQQLPQGAQVAVFHQDTFELWELQF